MSYTPNDKEKRGGIGVLTSLNPDSNSVTRIVFDDVARQLTLDGTTWIHKALFTVAEYPTEKLERVALSKEEFALIGKNIVIRLLAQAGRLRNDK